MNYTILKTMDNFKKFCKQIKQAPNRGVEENAECSAIKFDDDDGLVASLTENYADQCRVDYVEIIENGLILIEMKDLQSKILENFERRPTQEELSGIFDNMIKKFKHSITLMAEIKPDLIPITNYLVWKNDTETNLMDKYLPKEFKDRPYQICRTNEICEKLSTFGTRLCQE